MQILDVESVLKEVQEKRKQLEGIEEVGQKKRRRTIGPVNDESKEGADKEDKRGAGGCRCQNRERTEDILWRMQKLVGKDLKSRVTMLERFDVHSWRDMCHPHVRAIASA